MTNLDSILKSRDITLLTNVHLVKAVVFPVFMYGWWELDYKESWASKNWCFWSVILEKTLESSLNCTEIQPVHTKGNQSWIFIERTDVEAETSILSQSPGWTQVSSTEARLCHPSHQGSPPDVKSWLTGKDPDAGKDWRQEEKGTTEDDLVGWHHQLNGHEFK